MNMHIPVLMQSWKQFGKMMIMMSVVEAQILTKQQMAREYSQLKLNHIIIVVRGLLIILSWNLSASSNLKKKSNISKKQN